MTFCGAFSVALVLPAQDAPKKNLTARELFYAAVQAPTAAPAADTAKATMKPGARPPKPAAKPVEVARADTRTPASPGIIKSAAATSKGDSGAAGPALGLRYTILKVAGTGTVEVAPDTVFHAGDRIQLRVEANNPGYLYIVSQGSSGTWKPIFPSPEVENGNNRVESLRAYTLPSDCLLYTSPSPRD